MSTYLEIVIQERTTDGRAILTHRHFHFTTQHAGDLALDLANCIAGYRTPYPSQREQSDPLRPCSICWQIPQEAPHDPR